MPQRLEFLREVARRESALLQYTADRLLQTDPEMRWVETLQRHPDLAERLDAFVSRFGRLQDTLGDKLLPVWLTSHLEPVGTVLDNLARAEKLGLVQSLPDWIEARNLRNRLIHEYVSDNKTLRSALQRAMELVPLLIDTATKLTGA